ncbi:unnamed protein product [Ilex paraguariensis]|uniref:Uncharacterized protein n=1 Tax=Ilex paraguariensis TaxID=185542 RepID=A0ABC8RQL3_9AQUA
MARGGEVLMGLFYEDVRETEGDTENGCFYQVQLWEEIMKGLCYSVSSFFVDEFIVDDCLDRDEIDCRDKSVSSFSVDEFIADGYLDRDEIDCRHKRFRRCHVDF